MIYRVRLEGGAQSSDQLEREFRLLASQIAFVAAFEGVSGRESSRGKTTIESRDRYDDDSLVRLSGGTFGFEYEGRHTFEMSPLEGDFAPLQPLPQPDYEVFWLPMAHVGTFSSRPGSTVQSVAEGPSVEGTGRQRQENVLVLTRGNGKPGPRSVHASAGADELLSSISGWPGVEAVTVKRTSEGWRAEACGEAFAKGGSRPVWKGEHESLDEAAGLLYEAVADALNHPATAPPMMS